MSNIECVIGKSDLTGNSGISIINNISRTLLITQYDAFNDLQRTSRWVSNGDIINTTILLQSSGRTNYQNVKEMSMDSLFGEYLSNPVSPETCRQRQNGPAKGERLSPGIDASIAMCPMRSTFSKARNTLSWISMSPADQPECQKKRHLMHL